MSAAFLGRYRGFCQFCQCQTRGGLQMRISSSLSSHLLNHGHDPRRTAAGRDDHALISWVSWRLSVLAGATGGAHNGAPRSQFPVFPLFSATGRGLDSPRLHFSWFAEIPEISEKFPPTEDLGLPALPEALFCFCPFPAVSCNFMCALWCALLSAPSPSPATLANNSSGTLLA